MSKRQELPEDFDALGLIEVMGKVLTAVMVDFLPCPKCGEMGIKANVAFLFHETYLIVYVCPLCADIFVVRVSPENADAFSIESVGSKGFEQIWEEVKHSPMQGLIDVMRRARKRRRANNN